MTLPRRIVPGTTYLITRRCADRRMHLLPSPLMNRIYAYALARAQLKHGAAVHTFGAMGNHSHEVVTDVRGVLPDFLRDFHREVALAGKAIYGIPENFWSAEKPSVVELHGAIAQNEKAVYVMLNPVRAGLVARTTLWPGAISLPETRRVVAQRPSVWFSDLNEDTLTLELTPPPTWKGDADSWHAWLADELKRREDEIGRERRAAGLPFLGAAKVLAQKPFDRPRNRDVLRPTRHPTLATGGDGALMRGLIAGLRAWRRAYYDALGRWRIDKSTVFPFGTWWLVQRANAAFG